MEREREGDREADATSRRLMSFAPLFCAISKLLRSYFPTKPQYLQSFIISILLPPFLRQPCLSLCLCLDHPAPFTLFIHSAYKDVCAVLFLNPSNICEWLTHLVFLSFFSKQLIHPQFSSLTLAHTLLYQPYLSLFFGTNTISCPYSLILLSFCPLSSTLFTLFSIFHLSSFFLHFSSAIRQKKIPQKNE